MRRTESPLSVVSYRQLFKKTVSEVPALHNTVFQYRICFKIALTVLTVLLFKS